MSVSKNSAVVVSELQNIDSISFNPQAIRPPYQEGKFFFDEETYSLTIYNDNEDTSLQIGQEHYIRAINNTGVTITNGAAVYISGEDSGIPEISLAKADVLVSSTLAGLATHDIEDGEIGYITTQGLVHNVDTSSFSTGDRIYLSASVAGEYTTTIPDGINYIVQVGVIQLADVDGSILVQNIAEGIAEQPQAEMWEVGNTAPTIINTVNIWETVVQLVSPGELVSWTHDGAGALTAGAQTAGKYVVSINASMRIASPNKFFDIAIAINDVVKFNTVARRWFATSDIDTLSTGGIINIADGDVITMKTRNITDASNIILVMGNVNLHRLQ